MKRLLRNEKGFTLVELMIVITIIAILAAVLIPKMGTFKDSSKNAGVDANARMVQAWAEQMIHKYKAGDGATFETDLKTKIGAELKNPMSGNDAVEEYSSASTTNQPAVTYNNTTTGDNPPSTGDNKVKGAVWYNAINDGGKLKLRIIPYYVDGTPGTEITVQ